MKCPTCGMPAPWRKRLVGKKGAKHSTQGDLIAFEKGPMGTYSMVVAMQGCPVHLVPLSAQELAGARMGLPDLERKLVLDLRFDEIQAAVRRIENRKGQPALLLVGHWAGSVALSDRFIQSALLACQVQFPGPFYSKAYGLHAAAVGAEVSDMRVAGDIGTMVKAANALGLQSTDGTVLVSRKAMAPSGPPAGRLLVMGAF